MMIVKVRTIVHCLVPVLIATMIVKVIILTFIVQSTENVRMIATIVPILNIRIINASTFYKRALLIAYRRAKSRNVWQGFIL